MVMARLLTVILTLRCFQDVTTEQEGNDKLYSYFGDPKGVSGSGTYAIGSTKPRSTIPSPSSQNALMPELQRWRQNPDGSITGFIYKSPSFGPGTKVTTSPVLMGAQPGSVVKTSSGSEYLLK